MRVICLAIFTLSLLIFGASFSACTKKDNRPRPSYLLHNTNGDVVNQDSFKGSVQVLFFGFISCQTVCPAVLQRISTSLSKLDDHSKPHVKALFVTIDPQRDTHSKLSSYVKKYSYPIIPLRAPPKELKVVADEFHVDFQIVNTAKGYTFGHTQNIFILGQDGSLAKIFKSEFDSKEFLSFIKTLL